MPGHGLASELGPQPPGVPGVREITQHGPESTFARASPGPGGHTLDGMDKSIALVTGANKGIGLQIARQLTGAGLTVYAGSRDAARGERAVEEIGGDARLLVLDVTDAASIASAARKVDTLDVLVNNAGISGDGKTADREDLGDLRRIYETNVFGVVR
jgi:NADP-dependent 3-hydroxy acid dehydrogenase YdfG